MKILFISPPRKYWPYINEYDNFMTPLWMACLAPVAIEAGFQVKCIDCMADKIGWNSLTKILQDENADIISISESHILFMPEQKRLIGIIKKTSSNSLLIAGGGHYSNQFKSILSELPIDLIIAGEGEETLFEVLMKYKQVKLNIFFDEVKKISGIILRNKDGIFISTSRKLISNLDSLPRPAWHLLPMKKYGASKYLFSPAGMCVFHSRGCICSCDFCSWWTNMAQRKTVGNEIKLLPKWRTKSAAKTVDELEELVKKYNINYFVFVDATWNSDAKWNVQFAKTVIERKLKFQWMAFMRVDFLLRDAKNGVLDSLVKSGLTHILIGLEHSCESVLQNDYNKKNQQSDDGKKLVKILQERYPTVFIQGTFIVGGENESKESIKSLAKYINDLKLDYTSVHILTPIPGTPIYDKYMKKGLIPQHVDYEKFDWNTPIIATKHLSKEDLLLEVYKLNKYIFNYRWVLRMIFTKNKYKRNMGIWGVLVSIKVAWDGITRVIIFRKKMFGMVTPKWYNK